MNNMYYTAFKVYKKFWLQLLDAAENCRHKSLDLARELLSAAFGRPLPEPGNLVQVRTLVRKCIVYIVYFVHRF